MFELSLAKQGSLSATLTTLFQKIVFNLAHFLVARHLNLWQRSHEAHFSSRLRILLDRFTIDLKWATSRFSSVAGDLVVSAQCARCIHLQTIPSLVSWTIAFTSLMKCQKLVWMISGSFPWRSKLCLVTCSLSENKHVFCTEFRQLILDRLRFHCSQHQDILFGSSDIFFQHINASGIFRT